MKDTLFEINISYIEPKKRILFFALLLVVLILNISILVGNPNNKSFALNDTLGYANNPIIKVYNTPDEVFVSIDDIKDIEILGSYKCKYSNCSILELFDSSGDVVIHDDGFLIYNYYSKNTNALNIDNINYQDFEVVDKVLYLKKDNKYALFNIDTNSFITDFIYDGITTNKLNLDIDYKIGGYYQDSKYNQTLDLYDKDNNMFKHLNYCINLNDSNKKGLCSEHVSGTISKEDVDKEIDIVLSQYPNLNDDRLFLIKSGIEAVGLPYLWGGGHTTLDATMSTANSTWGIKNVYLSNGFKNQVAGNYYPDGLDCAGFVRWVYYIASGVDLYKDRVNVISGRNQDVSLIDESELLPGDIILDKDHVVIYLYKDETGKPISVHSAYDHLKVEISNYKRGNKYYRLNIWK